MVELGVEASLLRAILEERKTVEGRLRSGKFITLRRGDKLSFREDIWQDDRIIKSTANQASATVLETRYFENFADMLEHIDYRLCLPAASSKQAALDIYRGFYSQSQEREHGVVAITSQVD